MSTRNITVKSVDKAWNEANKLIPNDYTKDESASKTAGYNIYRSHLDWRDHICDLNDRLEVNLHSGETINIWIKDQVTDVSVEAVAKQSEETRYWDNYEFFIKDFRFFMSSGIKSDFPGSDEIHFNQIIKALRDINYDGMEIKTHRSGLTLTFKYNRWK